MANGRFVNDVCFRGGGPVDFKDLRTRTERDWACFKWRPLVVLRTAISLEKESNGRESDLKGVLLGALRY